MKKRSWRWFAVVLTMSLVVAGLVRADRQRFQIKQEALRQACLKERQALGLTDTAAVKNKYPTPEIHLVSGECLPPGGTGEIIVQGKFAPNTKFVFENDWLEVIRENQTGNTYRATLKAAPGVGPISAGLWAISPVSGITAQKENAVLVAGSYEFDLKAANGWRILARTSEDDRCRNKEHRGESVYEVSFFRGAEKNPFEKRSARLHYSVYEEASYRFSIDQTDPSAMGGMADFQQLMKKLGDPNLSEDEREKLMKQMETVQARMQEEMSKMTDPAVMQKMQQEMERKKKEFGCQGLALAIRDGGASGQLHCSDAVGSNLAVNGTVKLITR